MNKRLEITWAGNVPGLAEHRLSLEAFGQPLILLLAAYRRIASNMLARAVSDTGRLKNEAKLIDLELESVIEGSAGIAASCVMHVPPGSNFDLFNTLTKRATEELLSDIEAESKGEIRNASVRNYLRSLPEGLTGQKYSFIESGYRRDVAFGSMHLAEGPREMPVLQENLYAIVGVGFEPGESYVRFKGANETVQCEATKEQVAAALDLRFTPVLALVVKMAGRKARLIRMRNAGEELPPLPPASEEELIFGKWDELLRRLAK